jgi:hypothetical protein
MKFLHDGRDAAIIRPTHAVLRAMPGYDRRVIADYVEKPAENADSTLFAAGMVLGEGRRIHWEIVGVLRVDTGFVHITRLRKPGLFPGELTACNS